MAGVFQIAGGKLGSGINQLGQALGNPLPDWGWTEKKEYQGSIPLTTQQRIDKSVSKTGGIAEGDYSTAVNLGYPSTTPSRTDGGILTPQQMTQNAQTVASQGQVLGDNTTAPGGGGGGGGGFDPKNRDINPGSNYFWDAADGWKPVNSGGGEPQIDLYAEVGKAFDDVLGVLPGQQTESEGFLRTAADTQKAGINEQLGYGVQNLDKQREGVRTMQAETLSDLAQSLRDQAKNINMYLGVRGVGGGSAGEAASFALQKLFGKERAGVQRQGMAQLGQIDTAETTLRSKASEMLNGVDTWYNSEMSSIAQQFNDLRNNIGMMKGNMRAQAVEALWNKYNQVESEARQYVLAINQAARDRLGQLNNLKLELADSSNFNPESIVYNEYGFNPNEAYAPADPDMFNPLALAKRKQEEEQI